MNESYQPRKLAKAYERINTLKRYISELEKQLDYISPGLVNEIQEYVFGEEETNDEP